MKTSGKNKGRKDVLLNPLPHKIGNVWVHLLSPLLSETVYMSASWWRARRQSLIKIPWLKGVVFHMFDIALPWFAAERILFKFQNAWFEWRFLTKRPNCCSAFLGLHVEGHWPHSRIIWHWSNSIAFKLLSKGGVVESLLTTPTIFGAI